MADSTNHIAVLDTFVDDAVERQLYAFQNSEKKSSHISIHAERFKNIMDIVVELCEARLLQNAEGIALNEIGKELNMTRYSDDDDVFRTSIVLREAGASQATTRTNIIEILSDVFDLDEADVYLNVWEGRVDIILIDVCVTSTSMLEELKRLLPLLCRFTIGTKSAQNVLGFGSLQEFRDKVDSENEIYMLKNTGSLGSVQIVDENEDDYVGDDWGYPYQIESSIN